MKRLQRQYKRGVRVWGVQTDRCTETCDFKISIRNHVGSAVSSVTAEKVELLLISNASQWWGCIIMIRSGFEINYFI